MLLYEFLPDLAFMLLISILGSCYCYISYLTALDQPRILDYTNVFVPWITKCCNIAKLKYLNSIQLFKVTSAGSVKKFFWGKVYAHSVPFTS